MTWREYRYSVLSDLYRIAGGIGWRTLARHLALGGAFRYVFWMRTCAFARGHWLLRGTVYPLARLRLVRLRYRLGISVPFTARIGSGFYIGHFGGIVVHPDSVIGRNCNLSQGVTIGISNRGERRGVPTLGDNVYVGPGAKIFGAVRVGNHAAVGANCVVTRDVPDYGVVVGIPGRVISTRGSEGYVNRTDYERLLGAPPGPGSA